MEAIKFENVKKAYGNNVVIPDIKFSIEESERLVLLGPSGCGKSTILRMIAGFETYEKGLIYLNQKDVKNVKPGKRDVAMVFQNYALYPHMNVENNIIYGLRENKVPKKEIKDKLEGVLDMLELTEYRKRKPKDLSGGQRQRVALARATVKSSSIFLLDEPLSNLDAQLRVSARQALLDIHEKFSQTIVYVTHDQIEAMTFATKIILLNKGKIQMYDTPYNVYHYPSNVFTAKFIGAPPMNLIPDMSVSQNHICFRKQRVYLDAGWFGYLAENKTYILGIRPENVILKTCKEGNKQCRAKVCYIENLGANYAVYLDIEGIRFVAVEKYVDFHEGDVVYMEFLQEHLHFFDSQSENNLGRPDEIMKINKMQEKRNGSEGDRNGL